MIPSFAGRHGVWRTAALAAVGLCAACGHAPGTAAPAAAAPSPAAPATAAAPAQTQAAGCLKSGDGYLRATLGGAVEAHIDWPNSGTQCEGESRGAPPGVRLSFRREKSSDPDLLLVFGLSGVQPGEPAHAVAANVTVIVQGTTGIYGTMGDSRCTVDSLEQRPLITAGTYRIEARGFCTQPAHAVRGSGDVLVSTFEFAGPVTYVTDSGND
jgi:hypothetical protein